ncbi:Vps51/Vps67-domain-containing protein [Elsinoe ampelina]|uniref:Vacuolar protein sorting-associated protein 51 homolog n=1 Tax=Elsinoe ampelina TaxID=302913 RepID=A0A6A6G2V2_9PEZI|nr:Vps51/Vps67-domain-containing protein [Elsinoe ampelina]
MNVVPSPRPSLTLSSRRTSTSTDTIVRSESSTRIPGAPTQRRNRAALREFYGIKNAAQTESTNSSDTLPFEDDNPKSELDSENFDADRYVRDLLQREGLEGVLKVEASLLKDIRGFDGEKKALIYDNYSKLIGATDTIRKMRGNMDPLKPTFRTLTPAISDIATTAEKLSSSSSQIVPPSQNDEKREKQRRAVQYVLETPTRLRRLQDAGQTGAAAEDWAKVSKLLEKWKDVPGAAEVRQECSHIMAG